MPDTDDEVQPFDPAKLTDEEWLDRSAHDDGRLADLAHIRRREAERKAATDARVPEVSAKVAAQIRSENRILTAQALEMERRLEEQAAAEDAERDAETAYKRTLTKVQLRAYENIEVEREEGKLRRRDPLVVHRSLGVDYSV